jgi:hypothetical protein
MGQTSSFDTAQLLGDLHPPHGAADDRLQTRRMKWRNQGKIVVAARTVKSC